MTFEQLRSILFSEQLRVGAAVALIVVIFGFHLFSVRREQRETAREEAARLERRRRAIERLAPSDLVDPRR